MISMPYPQTREQLNELFKKKTVVGERCYTFEEAKSILKDQIFRMDDYGYDFVFKEWGYGAYKFKETKRGKKKSKKKVVKGKLDKRVMKRKIKIKLKCNNGCQMPLEKKNQKKDQIQNNNQRKIKRFDKFVQKAWSSYYGLGQIIFEIRSLQSFLNQFNEFTHESLTIEQQVSSKRYPYIILWKMRFYREQCKQCGRYGYTTIYKSQLQPFVKSFCLIISEILDEIGLPQMNSDQNQRVVKKPPQHQNEFCEACAKKVCFWYIWNKKYQEQEGQRTPSQSNNDSENGDPQNNPQNGALQNNNPQNDPERNQNQLYEINDLND